MIHDDPVAASSGLRDRYDVCIAGGGVAGVVLAITLAEKGKRVLLLEAGGLEYSEQSQEFYRGTSLGKEYEDLRAARLRFLGGSSNHWGGWCHPLDRHDFERRAEVPYSGWPISYEDVRPYQARAAEILEIEDFPEPRIVEQSAGNLVEVAYRYSKVKFGPKYLDVLKGSERIDLVLNANVTDAQLDTETSRVTSLTYRGYGSDAPAGTARAHHFVIAMGGIENARFLLNANRQRAKGLGNEHDLVGRFFMEHPHYDCGVYLIDPTKTGYGRERVILMPTRQYLREARIGSCNIRLERIDELVHKPNTMKRRIRAMVCGSDTLKSLYTVFDDIRCPRLVPGLKNAAYMTAAFEQMPNPSSRVHLTDERDALGLRHTALDWRLGDTEKRILRATALEVGHYFARADFGRVRIDEWLLEEDAALPDISDGQQTIGRHHMGTTRMGATARNGVVDADCKLFGTENLYMAGSSVFSTGGSANPTFTIVQLTLRLADHLARS